ncbi:isochorismatase family protein [Leclercia adecarboxylata]|uniref:hypothetical protein n=1 Tax=Leclercia adecarboxylata TaxID=83655 RepID=UPI002DBFF0F3|nr:hypothetical protein [Leclercia adecarboxylata]MEB6378582.1 isochorismatase family protein [Leclercia adecarboxylata]
MAGFCVNATVRMGADLGLQMTVLRDAVISFELEQQKPFLMSLWGCLLPILLRLSPSRN